MASELPLALTGRSSSHFTRVARMVAHELGLSLELRIVHELMNLAPTTWGGHPALKIPTLHVGPSVLFGTDNICRRLAEVAGRADDPRVVLSSHLSSDLARSAQELVWQSMATQVQLVGGVQLSRLPADNVFFVKARAGMLGTLGWLEERLEPVLSELPPSRQFSVFEVALFCLLEHLVFRATVPLEPFPRLRSFAATFGERDSARSTTFQFDSR